MTQGERIMGVEVEVRELKNAFEAHKATTAQEFKDVNSKLDELLAIRNKGAGVFWLASTLIGTGILGGILQLMAWFKGH